MALPISRNRTYDIGSPVRRADINDLQDQIIRLNDGRRGPRRRLVHPTSARWEDPASGVIVAQNGWVENVATAEFLYFPVEVEEGDRLIRCELMVDPANSGTPCSFSVRRDTGNGLSAGVSGVIAASGTAIQKLTTGDLLELVGAGDVSYYAVVAFGGTAGHRIGPLYVWTDRP